jgi:uncharacterized repeat protein (TIGR03803 family)
MGNPRLDLGGRLMRFSSYDFQLAQLLAAAQLLLVGSGAVLGEDTYNGTELSIPSVGIGSATYSNMVVTPASIVAVQGGKANGSADSYNPANNQLTIPAVYYAGTTFTNVIITVANLVSVGGVTGADTYNAPDLFIPSVQLLGGALYTDAMITVSSIVSPGGGMPKNVMDVYNSANDELTISGIGYGGNVYTNAIIKVGTIMSVNGPQIPDSILYSFSGQGGVIGSKDGAQPTAALVQGIDGNLYGTTGDGGAYTNLNNQIGGAGTVFKITAAGAETVLYSFTWDVGITGSADGGDPSGLLQGTDGNFYGTTQVGGYYNQGTVFSITPAGVETVLYSFSGNGGIGGSPDGATPVAGLIQSSDGDFYGTTEFGGGIDNCNCGTVFKITPAGVETVLYSFQGLRGNGGPDGSFPVAGLIQGTDGNFYGTTKDSVFKITPSGKETVLHIFGQTGSDGENAVAGLIQGSDGSFYGTTGSGGAYKKGIVFKVTATGDYTLLYSFSGLGGISGSTDAATPLAGLIQGTDGNFYGTTYWGGAYTVGTVFRITPTGAETVLHSFSGDVSVGGGTSGSTDGANPTAGLIEDNNGNLYGTTDVGGKYGVGSVFVLTNIVPPN